MAKSLGGLNSPVNESQGGTNATTFNAARTNMGLNALVNEQNAGYTALESDRNKLIHYTGAGGVTLDLTAAATLLDGWSVVVRNDAASSITINPDGAELIDGAAALTLEPTRAINIYCTGTEFLTQGQSSEIDGANQALSNLASVAINTTLVSDTDVTDNLGTQAIRWNTAYLQNLQTGDTAADVLNIGAWDVDGAAISNFITLTAGNTPTCALASGVTAVTQSPSDNSTKLATTAYVDAAASAGDSWVLLSSQTASASATIDFSNLLDSTYLNYVLVISGMVPATNNTRPYLRVGTGAGPSWKSGAADYQWAQGICEAAGAGFNGTGSNAAAQIVMSYDGITGATTHSFNAVLYIYNVTNTSTWKHINGNGSYIRNASTILTSFYIAGTYVATTAITSLRLLMSSGNISTGTFKLYGIKN